MSGVDLVAAVGEMAEEIDTIGGLIVTLAGRVPSRGELITGPGDLEFEVLDADPRRVKRLRLHRGPMKIAPLIHPGPSAAEQQSDRRSFLAPDCALRTLRQAFVSHQLFPGRGGHASG